MQDSAFSIAVELISSGNADLFEIIALSLRVSLLTVLLSCLVGLPIGALLATRQFRGRRICVVALNAMMGMPPVVIGLMVYLALSRSGPLGWLGLLYTPTAMIIAQTLLIAPIVAALSRQVLEDLYVEYHEQFESMRIPAFKRVMAVLQDGRYALLTVALAGFGRSIAEVGAVIIVGGNIEHLTRVMTTAIALETSKGDLPLAMALGIILMLLALAVNAVVSLAQQSERRLAYG